MIDLQAETGEALPPREIAVRMAMLGIIHSVGFRSRPWSGLTEHNAAEVVRRGIQFRLREALQSWEAGGPEPDWMEALSRVRTEGETYVGPTGTWIEFGPEDAPSITRVARAEVEDVRSLLVALQSFLASCGVRREGPQEP